MYIELALRSIFLDELTMIKKLKYVPFFARFQEIEMIVAKVLLHLQI